MVYLLTMVIFHGYVSHIHSFPFQNILKLQGNPQSVDVSMILQKNILPPKISRH